MKNGVEKIEHAIGLLLEVNTHKYDQGLFTSHNIEKLIEYFRCHNISLNNLSSNTLIPLSTLKNLYKNPKKLYFKYIQTLCNYLDFPINEISNYTSDIQDNIDAKNIGEHLAKLTNTGEIESFNQQYYLTSQETQLLIPSYCYESFIRQMKKDLNRGSDETMLEYMSPIYVIIWLVLRKKDKLKILDTLSLIILIFSLFLLLTNGDIKTLKVSDQSLFWGIISGVSLAFYTIYSKKLLIKFPSLLIIGWSMIIGGLLMNIKFPIWDINLKEIQITNIILILLNILTGTALAYWLYIKSVEYINEKKTIIFSTIEPIITITSSVFIMHISFEKYQTIGIILILISITQLSLKK